MTTAQRITKRMEETGRVRGKQSIYAVVSDAHSVLCLTEEMIDTWWNELTPDDKADLYERHLNGTVPTGLAGCSMPRGAFEVSPSAILAMHSVVEEFESMKAVSL